MSAAYASPQPPHGGPGLRALALLLIGSLVALLVVSAPFVALLGRSHG